MRIDIISCQPALLASPFDHSIVARAKSKGLVEIGIHNLHDFSDQKNRRVDDYPFGGGGGMVLQAAPLAAAIRHLQALHTYDEVIFLTPDAPVLTQPMANGLSLSKALLLICGHYKGIDERIRSRFVTREISIGDYVLTGGELAAAVLVDAIVRIIPGVIGDEVSALTDSFQDGLLSAPVYTRPAVWEGLAAPGVLTSGHDLNIQTWRHEQQLERTRQKRPDLMIER